MTEPLKYLFVTGSREFGGSLLREDPTAWAPVQALNGDPAPLFWLLGICDVLVHGDCRGFDRACADYVAQTRCLHLVAAVPRHGPGSEPRPFRGILPVPMLGSNGPGRNKVMAELAQMLHRLGHRVRVAAYIQPGLQCRGTRGCIGEFARRDIPISVFGAPL